jgi:hypothetical protein
MTVSVLLLVMGRRMNNYQAGHADAHVDAVLAASIVNPPLSPPPGRPASYDERPPCTCDPPLLIS